MPEPTPAQPTVSSVWPVLHYDDPSAAVQHLVNVIGFRPAVVAHDDGGEVVHAELRWPGGGALVLGSTKHLDSVHGDRPSGVNAVYLVTDAPSEVHTRVQRNGGDIIEPLHETRFGSGATSTVFTARDPEGNLWTFGDHRGEG